MTTGDVIRLPDDCTVGYIISKCLKKSIILISVHTWPWWHILKVQKKIKKYSNRFKIQGKECWPVKPMNAPSVESSLLTVYVLYAFHDNMLSDFSLSHQFFWNSYTMLRTKTQILGSESFAILKKCLLLNWKIAKHEWGIRDTFFFYFKIIFNLGWKRCILQSRIALKLACKLSLFIW